MDALRTLNPNSASLSITHLSMPGIQDNAGCRCSSAPVGQLPGLASPWMASPAMPAQSPDPMLQMNQTLLSLMQMMLQLMLNRASGGNAGGATPAVESAGGSSEASGGSSASGGAASSSAQGAPAANDTGKKLAEIARAEATNGDSNGGLCYRDVGRALSKIGINVSGASAYMAADQLAKNPKVKEVKVAQNELSKLPAGAIVVWDKGNGHEHGHISIATGDGKEASDLMRTQITNYGTRFRVFMPV